MKIIRNIAVFAVSLLSLAACNTTTVLHSTFDMEPAGTPPLRDQPVGTVLFRNGAGSVTIAPAPGDTTGWVQISHPAGTDPTELRARFDASHGTGKYTLLAVLYIPSGAGPVTLRLETLGDPSDIYSSIEFLRLEFRPDGVAAYDAVGDRPRPFGTYQHDHEFVVSISVDSTVRPPTATLSVLHGATTTARASLPFLPGRASDFGAVRVVMDEAMGSVFVSDLLVTRQNM